MISQIQVGDVAVEIVRPRVVTDTGRVMMHYIHGGGYVTDSPQTHRAFTGRLALELQRDILTSTRTTELSFARHYAGSCPRTDPLLSPLYGDPTGLPSTYVQVSDTEIFEDDSRSFVAQALIAGVDVTLEVGHGLWHAWPLFAPFLPEATRSIAILAIGCASPNKRLSSDVCD